MKYIIFSIAVLFLVACSDEKSKKNEEIKGDSEIFALDDEVVVLPENNEEPSHNSDNDEVISDNSEKSDSDNEVMSDADDLINDSDQVSDFEIFDDDLDSDGFDKDNDSFVDAETADDNDEVADIDNDSDVLTPKNEEWHQVPKAGGEVFFFENRVRILFPENWNNTSLLIGIRELEKGNLYEFIDPPERFLKPLRVGIFAPPFLKIDEEQVLVSIRDNLSIRLNRSGFEEDFASADISFPIVFSTAPRGSAVCPGDDDIEQQTRNIYSEIVYNKNHQIVTIDSCMDRFEASLVTGSGTTGNADQTTAATALVTSAPGEIPLRSVSFYQAKQLCQNSGKELCGDLEWQVACEGAYNPHNPAESPCFYGLAGSGCYSFDESLCHLKTNHAEAEASYDKAKYQCNLNYKYCTDLDAVCQTNLTTCLTEALDEYNNTFRGGNFPFCHSVFQIDNIIGNLMEWISYQNIDGTFEEGVLRGGSYSDGESNNSDLKCRPESAPGFQINPEAQLETVGFRCCIL